MKKANQKYVRRKIRKGLRTTERVARIKGKGREAKAWHDLNGWGKESDLFDCLSSVAYTPATQKPVTSAAAAPCCFLPQDIPQDTKPLAMPPKKINERKEATKELSGITQNTAQKLNIIFYEDFMAKSPLCTCVPCMSWLQQSWFSASSYQLPAPSSRIQDSGL